MKRKREEIARPLDMETSIALKSLVRSRVETTADLEVLGAKDENEDEFGSIAIAKSMMF
jgi:hypothetical protein